MTLGDSILIAIIGALAALLGAAVGGWLAYRGAVDAAKMTLKAQMELARQATEVERSDRRTMRQQDAAMVLLDTLNVVIGELTQASERPRIVGAPRLEADEHLRRVVSPYAHLAGPEILTDWVRLEAEVAIYAYPKTPRSREEAAAALAVALTRANSLHDSLLRLIGATDTIFFERENADRL